MLSIDVGLGVVALNPAVCLFVDVAVGISEIALGLGFWLSGCIRGELAVWNLQWIAFMGNLLGIICSFAGTTAAFRRYSPRSPYHPAEQQGPVLPFHGPWRQLLPLPAQPLPLA
ncbi:hypothetical protein KBY83_08050 [Cyanobium sp. WKJ7-Wakatipu]|uniref:hypothetical protein n=1 Tax=Cyanobium sp. WKJ7-Wakatipu TaxID=2823726 RepID=UPI0020CC6489|nr:hypothetical protein [Cyanobium sp. WKJ7-Wakatipu]MCP9783272.1 hypothetical protein [Cyanobium sp. WKJ7-Wakatipu]